MSRVISTRPIINKILSLVQDVAFAGVKGSEIDRTDYGEIMLYLSDRRVRVNKPPTLYLFLFARWSLKLVAEN